MIGLAFLGTRHDRRRAHPDLARRERDRASSLVLASYALRARATRSARPDVANLSLDPAWPSWISPIGWGQQTLAFTDDNWWPRRRDRERSPVVAAAALVVHSRRELGASLLLERTGARRARAWLGSPFALAWRLQSAALLAWARGRRAARARPRLIGHRHREHEPRQSRHRGDHAEPRAQQGDLGRALIPAILIMVGLLSAAAGVQAVLRMREEESDGRPDEVLAAPRSRVGWLLAGRAVGALTVLGVLLATGLAAAAGFPALGKSDEAWLALGQALAAGARGPHLVGLAALSSPCPAGSDRSHLGRLRSRGRDRAFRGPDAAAGRSRAGSARSRMCPPFRPTTGCRPSCSDSSQDPGPPRRRGVPSPRSGDMTDADLFAEFIERSSSEMAAQGFPRMPARVLMALTATEEGRATSEELAATLQASPAAISGAVRYLGVVGFVRNTTIPGTRKHSTPSAIRRGTRRRSPASSSTRRSRPPFARRPNGCRATRVPASASKRSPTSSSSCSDACPASSRTGTPSVEGANDPAVSRTAGRVSRRRRRAPHPTPDGPGRPGTTRRSRGRPRRTASWRPSRAPAS